MSNTLFNNNNAIAARLKRSCAVMALAFFALPAMAQDNDFGIDLSASLEKKISKRLSMEADATFRTQDNTSRAERYSLSLGADYKFIDHKRYTLKGGLGYEHIWSQTLSECEPKSKTEYGSRFDYIGGGNFAPRVSEKSTGYNYTDAYWRQRSRVNLSVSLGYKPNKRWSFSLKETLQYTHYYSASTTKTKVRDKEIYDDGETLYAHTVKPSDVHKDAKDRMVLRNKLTAQYDIRKCPLAPFASVDYGVGLGNDAQKWKFTAGTEIKLSKKTSLDVFYRFQTENDDDEPNGHLAGISFSHKL